MNFPREPQTQSSGLFSDTVTIKTSYIGYTLLLILVLIVIAYYGWSSYYTLKDGDYEEPEENEALTNLGKSAVTSFGQAQGLDSLKNMF